MIHKGNTLQRSGSEVVPERDHSFPAHVLDDRAPEPPRRPPGVLDEIGRLVDALGA